MKKFRDLMTDADLWGYFGVFVVLSLLGSAAIVCFVCAMIGLSRL